MRRNGPEEGGVWSMTDGHFAPMGRPVGRALPSRTHLDYLKTENPDRLCLVPRQVMQPRRLPVRSGLRPNGWGRPVMACGSQATRRSAACTV